MTDIEVRELEEVMHPVTGELVSLQDTNACADLLGEVRDLERNLRELKARVSGALLDAAKVLGVKTLPITGGRKAVISGGPEKRYDAEEIEEGLRALGMPDERIAEIVKTEIIKTVSAQQAKRAAGVNTEYAAVIESATTEVEKPYYVQLRAR